MVFRHYILLLLILCLAACNVTKLYTRKIEKSYDKMGMKEWYVELDSSVVHWRKVGNSPKKIVLIHGYGILPQLQWEKVAKELHEEYTLYIPDLIYFGDSRSNTNVYSPQFQSRQIAKSMKELNIGKAYIAGLSYGGMVAALIAHENPTDTRGLILIDALSKFTDEGHIQRLADSLDMEDAEDLLLPDNGKEMKKLFEASFYDPPNYPKFLLNTAAKKLYADPEGNKAAVLSYLFDHETELRNLDVKYYGPVLIIWGEQDLLIPVITAGMLQEYYQKAELAILPNTGHVTIMEKSEEVSEIIKLFVD